MAIKISWQEAIWFFDIDDTLIDFVHAHKEGIKALSHVLVTFYGGKGTKIGARVDDIFMALLQGHHARTERDWQRIDGGKEKIDEIIRRCESYQQAIVKRYGTSKTWSRETYTKIAADDLGVSITPALVDEAVGAYWQAIGESSYIYPDALKLFDIIRLGNRPIYLTTGSDARLTMQKDNTFKYDPVDSTEKKMKRIRILEQRGIKHNGVLIADPEGKATEAFYSRALAYAKDNMGRKIDRVHCIMVGDSWQADLAIPKEKLGFGLVVLVDRSRKETKQLDDRFIVVKSLLDLLMFLS